MDTPFNIGSYTAQTIEDQGARTVADVMIDDPSVRSTHSTGGILGSFYIRGFPINEGNFGEVAFDGVFGSRRPIACSPMIPSDRGSQRTGGAPLWNRAEQQSRGVRPISFPSARAEVDLTRSNPQGRLASQCEPAFRRRAAVRGPIQRQ
ncbi:Plug domain-containing protein [Mesorhizobium sp. M1076]|uniref:Plug domain-containing protein n=1 Tax=Mesorhizobium sp. M1076 TaxID=2957054 RepID=UPI00333BC985